MTADDISINFDDYPYSHSLYRAMRGYLKIVLPSGVHPMLGVYKFFGAPLSNYVRRISSWPLGAELAFPLGNDLERDPEIVKELKIRRAKVFNEEQYFPKESLEKLISAARQKAIRFLQQVGR